MIDGTRMPKRTRPSGNHLSEYIIRTRQPVLIRENYVEEVQKAGSGSDSHAGDASAACRWWPTTGPSERWRFSRMQERTFDEGHLEIVARAGQRSEHRD